MGKSWKKIMEDFDDDGMSQAFCFWGETDGFSESGMKFGNGKNGKRGTSPKN